MHVAASAGPKTCKQFTTNCCDIDMVWLVKHGTLAGGPNSQAKHYELLLHRCGLIGQTRHTSWPPTGLSVEGNV